LAWGARVLQPYVDPTQSIYFFALTNFVLFALVSVSIFFAISSISGDKLSVFIPAAFLTTGVLFYGSATSSYLQGWHTFLFSQLIAFLVVLVMYKHQNKDSQSLGGHLYIGVFLCLLTNIWYLMGFVLVITYVISNLFPSPTKKNFVSVVIAVTPAIISPFYFLYPSVGLSALVSGDSPGYSWRLFLITFAIVTLFGISSRVRDFSKYSKYSLSVATSVGVSVFGLFVLVQIDASGTTYYLAKLIQGCFVILLSTITLIMMEELILLGSKYDEIRVKRRNRFILSFLLSFILLQSQVYLGPSFQNSTDSLPLNANNNNIRLLLGSSQEAIRLSNVANYVKKQQAETLYLSTFNTDPNNRLADLWVRVLAGKWTYESEESGVILNNVSQSNVDSILEATKMFLGKYPRGVVVISSDFFGQYEAQLSSFNESNFYLIDDFGRVPSSQ
jgi:hypothetical protein